MKRLPIVPTIVVALAIATMIALGVWQLQRRAEKAALVARYTANAGRAPTALPAIVTDAMLFRRVATDCVATGTTSALAGRAVDGTSGFRHVAGCRTDAGAEIAVELGVSTDPTAPVRWAGGPVTGTLTRAPDASSAIARTVSGGDTTTPMIVAETPPAGLLPSRRPDPATIPDNHLAYAIQWFAFAAIALVIYALALRRRSR